MATPNATSQNGIDLAEKLATFSEHWKPKIVGELNGQQVKLVKFAGEFVWHHHEQEDELFLVVDGRFRMELRDRTIELGPGEMLIVPRGAEPRPGSGGGGWATVRRPRRRERKQAGAAEQVGATGTRISCTRGRR